VWPHRYHYVSIGFLLVFFGKCGWRLPHYAPSTGQGQQCAIMIRTGMECMSSLVCQEQRKKWKTNVCLMTGDRSRANVARICSIAARSYSQQWFIIQRWKKWCYSYYYYTPPLLLDLTSFSTILLPPFFAKKIQRERKKVISNLSAFSRSIHINFFPFWKKEEKCKFSFYAWVN